MNLQRIKELRVELDAERISYGELAEIDEAFNELVASGYELRDLPENAMASDQLEELEQAILDTHHQLREILQKYGNAEFGDAIIDEICGVFNYPVTGEDDEL